MTGRINLNDFLMAQLQKHNKKETSYFDEIDKDCDELIRNIQKSRMTVNNEEKALSNQLDSMKGRLAAEQKKANAIRTESAQLAAQYKAISEQLAYQEQINSDKEIQNLRQEYAHSSAEECNLLKKFSEAGHIDAEINNFWSTNGIAINRQKNSFELCVRDRPDIKPVVVPRSENPAENKIALENAVDCLYEAAEVPIDKRYRKLRHGSDGNFDGTVEETNSSSITFNDTKNASYDNEMETSENSTRSETTICPPVTAIVPTALAGLLDYSDNTQSFTSDC